MNEIEGVRRVLGEAGKDAVQDVRFFMNLGASLTKEGNPVNAETAFHCAAGAARQMYSANHALQEEARMRVWHPEKKRWIEQTSFLKGKALRFKTQALINADRLFP